MNTYLEASGLKKTLVGLIDAIIALGLLIAINIWFKPEIFNQPLVDMNGFVITLMILALYRLIGLILFNQTIGMALFKVVLLNGNEQKLSIKEKVLAAFFVLYRGTDYYGVIPTS